MFGKQLLLNLFRKRDQKFLQWFKPKTWTWAPFRLGKHYLVSGWASELQFIVFWHVVSGNGNSLNKSYYSSYMAKLNLFNVLYPWHSIKINWHSTYSDYTCTHLTRIHHCLSKSRNSYLTLTQTEHSLPSQIRRP